jgi:hypothetical protein
VTQRLAHAIVRCYPLAWRERYEPEVCALIDDSSMRLRDLAELVRGLLTERARELVSSDDRPKRTLLIVSLMKPVWAVTFVGCAAATGLGIQLLTGPWSERAQETTAWGVLAFVIVFVVALIRLRVRPWFASTDSAPPYPAWVGVTLLPCLFIVLASMVAARIAGPSPDDARSSLGWVGRYSPLLNWWFYATWAADLSSSLWPTQRLLLAFSAVSVLEGRIKGAEQWVDGCKEWIAKGVPSPLADAEAQLALAKRRLEEARERVHSVGYRARFRQHPDGALIM